MPEDGLSGTGRASILEALRVHLERKGFSVHESTGASDLVAELNTGVFSVRIGVLVHEGDDLASAIGRAFLAKNDEELDKVVVIVVGGERASRVVVNGIEVVPSDRLKIAPLNIEVDEYFVRPRITRDEVERLAERHKGWLLSRRGEFAGARTVFLPLYCFTVLLHTLDYAPEALEARTETLCFDAVTGSLMGFDNGLVPMETWSGIGEISDEAVEVLLRISDLGEASIAELKEEFGTVVDVDSVIDVLVEKGLVEPVGEDAYTLAKPPLTGYRNPLAEAQDSVEKGRPSCGRILRAHVGLGKMERIVGAYGVIKKESMLYYPIHVLVYVRRKGDKSVEVAVLIDGFTGERLAETEEMLASSPAVTEFDEVIDEVVRSRRDRVSVCTSAKT